MKNIEDPDQLACELKLTLFSKEDILWFNRKRAVVVVGSLYLTSHQLGQGYILASTQYFDYL